MGKIQISPYVNFQGRAREAMAFYHAVLGGNLDLHAIDEQGKAKPAGGGDRVALARLETDGALILGGDGHPAYPPTVGDNLAIALTGIDKDRLTAAFNGLAEGGVVKMPPTRQPWGAEVGWMTDKFGINWTIAVEEE
ncbi:MAG TPA: VOC family protein [Thermomicrobiales bacterium]